MSDLLTGRAREPGDRLMPVARSTPVYRLVHVDNLPTLLRRGALHAPNHTPNDGLPYRTIHDTSVQASRRVARVPCGPGGSIHDYVSFYFGPLSVMLLKLKTGQVEGYDEGQEALIYLVANAQEIASSGGRFVFSDGHGLATFTSWFDDLARLNAVDWKIVKARYWADQPDDNDRQRRKQAEFLVWRRLDWSLIECIGVLDRAMMVRVEQDLDAFPKRHRPLVEVKRDWYYY